MSFSSDAWVNQALFAAICSRSRVSRGYFPAPIQRDHFMRVPVDHAPRWRESHSDPCGLLASFDEATGLSPGRSDHADGRSQKTISDARF